MTATALAVLAFEAVKACAKAVVSIVFVVLTVTLLDDVDVEDDEDPPPPPPPKMDPTISPMGHRPAHLKRLFLPAMGHHFAHQPLPDRQEPDTVIATDARGLQRPHFASVNQAGRRLGGHKMKNDIVALLVVGLVQNDEPDFHAVLRDRGGNGLLRMELNQCRLPPPCPPIIKTRKNPPPMIIHITVVLLVVPPIVFGLFNELVFGNIDDG